MEEQKRRGNRALHTRSRIRFGPYELDLRTAELRKNTLRIRLQEQPFLILVALLERPGELVLREEIRNKLWPDDTVVEFDHGINAAVKRLREALCDSVKKPRYIETLSRRGYRFIGNVEFDSFEQTESSADRRGIFYSVAEEVNLEPESSRYVETLHRHDDRLIASANVGAFFSDARVETFTASSGRARHFRWMTLGAVTLAALLAVGFWYLHRPLPPPRITDYPMITLDGMQKQVVGTDGSKLYLNVMTPRGIAQVPISGGPITRIPVELLADDPSSDDPGGAWGLSPDGSSFLVRSHWDGTMYDMSVVGTQGHPARYLARASNAAWSPDGKSVIYSTAHGDFYRIPSTGGEPRLLLSSSAPDGENLGTYDLSWSPDGSKIRFTRNHELWEVSSNGTNLHQLLPGWHSSSLKCCGRWTPDGEFFLYVSGNTLHWGSLIVPGAQLWAIDERRGRLRPPIAQPIQLTSGPIGWGRAIPSRDGKRIFAQGVTARGELVRYDRRSNQFQPYLGGTSAEFVAFSRDGKYVAYVTFPEGILWRANRDGTGLMQLSEPPLHPTGLRWSPDGSQILFIDSPKAVSAMFVVPALGGTPTRVLPEDKRSEGDATWSSDGKELVYDSHSVMSYSAGPQGRNGSEVRVLDLASHKTTTVPASEGMSSPRLSPDGRYIAAQTATHGLRVFDRESQRWTTLQKAPVNWPCWSQDSRSVYFLGPDPLKAVSRISVDGGEPELVVDLKDFRGTGWYAGWMGMDPSEAPLLLRDVGTNEIYSLRLER